MDIHGPSCESLLATAVAGVRPRRGRFGTVELAVRPVAIEKIPGGLWIDGWHGRHLAVAAGASRWRNLLPWPRVAYRCRIAADGHAEALKVSDPEIERAVGEWLAAAGNLVDVTGVRELGEAPSFWPSEVTLPLIDETWRGDVAFLLANVALCCVRKYVAVRSAAESRLLLVDGLFAPASAPVRVPAAA